jgi:hypothetical protein
MPKTPEHPKRPACSLCGQKNPPITQCEGGYVCEDCAEKSRDGKDTTTRAVKTQQRSMRGQAQKVRTEFTGGVIDEQLEYEIECSGMLATDALQLGSAVTTVDGGEVLPRHDMELVDTLAAPGATALDASANRLDLITNMGNDVAAMALDASETIQASNSLEKMLAHQLAACHDGAMRYVSKGNLEQDPVHSVRMLNLAVRLMETYQKGLLTLKRLRGSGEQRIVIQHVDVREGGQAVISQSTPRGGSRK